MGFDDRVAAVGIATQFQESSKDVFKMVEEETDFAKTQVFPCKNYPVTSLDSFLSVAIQPIYVGIYEMM